MGKLCLQVMDIPVDFKIVPSKAYSLYILLLSPTFDATLNPLRRSSFRDSPLRSMLFHSTCDSTSMTIFGITVLKPYFAETSVAEELLISISHP